MGFDEWRFLNEQRRVVIIIIIIIFLLGHVMAMVMHWIWMCNVGSIWFAPAFCLDICMHFFIWKLLGFQVCHYATYIL